jgi:hypothetical protein
MVTSRRGLPYWQIAMLAVLAALWIALSVPLVLGRGDVQGFFLSTFEGSFRPHPFVSLSPIFFQFWIAHSCLLIFGIVAMMVRMSDLFSVLIIGPILALLVAFVSQQWADPDWITVAGVCFIGWMVGVVAGGVYCVYQLCVRPEKQRDAMKTGERRAE